ncbi:hypothetical protein BDV33DRAFT_210128 [Aspergillus novoparasiticus]|uniref:Clr5 domain-containing protein n=1 Tax=Aspergillus novoparasiticus TaxID=986946 RepID=A0A5N6E9P6_9EURO|nr:hypothetical protein BDV33DRAFT_210128 [Aspergillus novoparasiticus]
MQPFAHSSFADEHSIISENQLRSRLKKWCITKSSRHQKWPKSLINQNRADPRSNYSFVQTAPNEVLNTANSVSAEQAGITATASLPNDHRLSQTPSLPSNSTLNGNESIPPAYYFNTLYSTTKDSTPAMQQVEAGPEPLQGQFAPMWWISEDGTYFLSTPYYVSAPVNP